MNSKFQYLNLNIQLMFSIIYDQSHLVWEQLCPSHAIMPIGQIGMIAYWDICPMTDRLSCNELNKALMQKLSAMNSSQELKMKWTCSQVVQVDFELTKQTVGHSIGAFFCLVSIRQWQRQPDGHCQIVPGGVVVCSHIRTLLVSSTLHWAGKCQELHKLLLIIINNETCQTPSSNFYSFVCQEDDEGIDMSGGGSSLGNTHENEKNRQHTMQKGPFVYELFSIMIHSGSASGGHYYAYIKDFSNGEWFCFNDQTVSRVCINFIYSKF